MRRSNIEKTGLQKALENIKDCLENDVRDTIFLHLIKVNCERVNTITGIHTDLLMRYKGTLFGIEYKKSKGLTNKSIYATALIEACNYTYRFIMKSNPDYIPKCMCLIDDKYFIIFSTSDLKKFIDNNPHVNWEEAHNSIIEHNPDIIGKLETNEHLKRKLSYDMQSPGFDLVDPLIAIRSLSDGNFCINIDPDNVYQLTNTFEYFKNNVIKQQTFSDEEKYKDFDNNVLIAYINILTETPNTHICKNILYTTIGEKQLNITVDINIYNTFMSVYINNNKGENKYSSEDKVKFSTSKDRILLEQSRREKGAFYTPPDLAQYFDDGASHRFGNYKENDVVIDLGSGPATLTLGRKYNNVVSLTIDQHDIDLVKNLNTSNKIYKMDIVNEEIPYHLIDIIKANNTITIISNPPYVTSGTSNGKATKSYHSKIKDEMDKSHIKNSDQLYIQFMYVMLKLKQKYNNKIFNIALICPPIWINSDKFKSFRMVWESNFEYMGGYYFESKEFFKDTQKWPLSITYWTNKNNINSSKNQVPMKEYVLDIITHDKKTYEIITIGNKIYKKTPKDKQLNEMWKLQKTKNNDEKRSPCTSNGFTFNENKPLRIFPDNALGYLESHSNRPSENAENVIFLSRPYTQKSGGIVTSDNFELACMVFTARRVILVTKENYEENYKRPNINHQQYNEFKTDAVIVSLFDVKSLQTSTRGVKYNEIGYDTYNEFYPFSIEETKKWADCVGFTKITNDEIINHADHERYVYKYLSKYTLSKESQDVFDAYKNVMKNSMHSRKKFCGDINDGIPYNNPDKYHVGVWDPGYKQLRSFIEEQSDDIELKRDLKLVQEKYKILEEKCRKMVYELGMLEKCNNII